MYKQGFAALLLMSCLTSHAMAQEGHPLVGSWLGDWGTSPDERNFLTLILEWDGENISGIVNPGPNATPVRMARLDSSTWTVTLEMDVQNSSGESVRLVAEGQLENIGSYSRSLSGSVRHADGSGDFQLARQ
ncbi:MAG: hypothetical protein WD601_01835 [Pseudohongiellaceae bacterium]